MDQNLIIQLLREKEASLMNDLQHVRDAINTFLGTKGELSVAYGHEALANLIPASYDACTTYNYKILFILKSRAVPMTVNEIVAEIIAVQPALEINKLHRTVSYSLSMLAKTGHLRKHPFNRHIKYSLLTV